MTIDPRLMERRKAVAEGRANRNLRRALKVMATLAVLAAGVWVALSPWLSVSQVRTTGIAASSAHETMASHGFVAGTPMILLRTGDVVEALEDDPWVAQAQVYLKWPNEVVVRVIERTPVAWVMTADGWARHALDGVALPSTQDPGNEHPRVELPIIGRAEAEKSPLALGAIEFVAALAEAHPDLIVRHLTGELWATVDGFDVRLGRPENMLAKARSLEALLTEQHPPGSVLILIAPTHPAVSLPPGAGEEAGESGEETTEDQP